MAENVMSHWTRERVEHLLKDVLDPEVGLNIIEMGLVYNVSVDSEANVEVLMTLTTPGCPMHGSIAEGVQHLLEDQPNIGAVAVELTFDPPWEPTLMSHMALKKLGWEYGITQAD